MANPEAKNRMLSKITRALVSPNGRDDTLKLVGMASMLVDHLGVVFFPSVVWLRIIGRLALPIFAYSLAEGYKHTSNMSGYVRRLLIFGLVAQLPFIFLINPYTLNIVFTLLTALLFINSVNKQKYLGIFLLLILIVFAPLEYSWYGILLAVIFYFARSSKNIAIILATSLTLVYSYYIGTYVQLFAILGILLVYWQPKDMVAIRLPRLFFYWFYPIHLALFLFFENLIRFIQFLF
jgi:hypothetical protein